MLGKFIASLVVLAVLFLGAVWFFTGQSPSQFIQSLTSTKTGSGLSTDNARDLLYNYVVVVGPDKKVYRFDVAVHVVKRTSDQLCYSYRVARVEQGDASFIRDFMYGYQGYNAENQVICTNLGGEGADLSAYFTSPDRSGEVSLGNGRGMAYVENGVLRSLRYSYTVSHNGVNVPVELAITLKSAGIGTEASETSASTTQTSAGEPGSDNVKTLEYRFTWRVHKIDVATGEPSSEETTTSYTVRVNIVNRDGDKVCLRYTIVGGGAVAQQAMSQLWPYPPGRTVCTKLSRDAQQIPYFLFPADMTTTQTFSGEGVKGVATIKNGVLEHLEIDSSITMSDNQHGARAPMKLVVDLVGAK
ncbi:MAG: hypothetical protein LRS48_05435 [Desulfurococcales archaeon]|nr:hypothetical protein [Desulfurococcales archaeon]